MQISFCRNISWCMCTFNSPENKKIKGFFCWKHVCLSHISSILRKVVFWRTPLCKIRVGNTELDSEWFPISSSTSRAWLYVNINVVISHYDPTASLSLWPTSHGQIFGRNTLKWLKSTHSFYEFGHHVYWNSDASRKATFSTSVTVSGVQINGIIIIIAN